MAKKTRLTKVAQGIGAAVGRADRAAHQVAKVTAAAQDELVRLRKDVKALTKKVKKATERLKRAAR